MILTPKICMIAGCAILLVILAVLFGPEAAQGLFQMFIDTVSSLQL